MIVLSLSSPAKLIEVSNNPIGNSLLVKIIRVYFAFKLLSCGCLISQLFKLLMALLNVLVYLRKGKVQLSIDAVLANVLLCLFYVHYSYLLHTSF